jgi:hypothetical protein
MVWVWLISQSCYLGKIRIPGLGRYLVYLPTRGVKWILFIRGCSCNIRGVLIIGRETAQAKKICNLRIKA